MENIMKTDFISFEKSRTAPGEVFTGENSQERIANWKKNSTRSERQKNARRQHVWAIIKSMNGCWNVHVWCDLIASATRMKRLWKDVDAALKRFYLFVSLSLSLFDAFAFILKPFLFRKLLQSCSLKGDCRAGLYAVLIKENLIFGGSLGRNFKKPTLEILTVVVTAKKFILNLLHKF